MKKFTFSLLLLGCCIFSQIPASAHTTTAEPHHHSGWYLNGSTSIDWHRNADLTSTQGKQDIDFETGINGAAALGYVFDEIRFEVEASIRHNYTGSITTTRIAPPLGNPSKTGTPGFIQYWSFLANLYLDIPIMPPFLIYLGGGIGTTIYVLDLNSHTDNFNGTLTNYYGIRYQDFTFAFQLMGGFTYECPSGLQCVYAGYRFFRTLESDPLRQNIAIPVGSPPVSYHNHREEFPYVHSIEIGIRFML